jgi:hypothetical protein
MTDFADALADVFVTRGPRPELADRMSLFAPLIGSWAIDVFQYDDDGKQTRSTAEWHFSWALDGRAVADVWITPPRAERGPDADGEWGLSLRFYDPDIDAWRSTWHAPKGGLVIPFIARADHDRGIVLEGTGDGTGLRWIFSDITTDSFRWRAEETEAGQHPFVRQRFEATRTA